MNDNTVDETRPCAEDEWLAIQLLNGRLVKRKTDVRHEYLGGEQEREARSALARLLLEIVEARRPLHPRVNLILLRLSQIIDPDSTHPRKLVFENRHGGKQPTPDMVEQAISFDLAFRADGTKMEDAAVSDAAKRYGLSERTIWRIWAKGFARAIRNENEY